MQKARTVIEHLLTKGKLEAAIEGSLLLASQYGDTERNSTVAQHSARYHSLMTDYHDGTLNDDEYRRERARINRAMLDLAQSIPTNWTEEPLSLVGFSSKVYDKASATREKSFLENWGLILGLVASLMGILGLTFRDIIFPKTETSQTDLPTPGSIPPKQAEKQIKEPENKEEPIVKKPPSTQSAIEPSKVPVTKQKTSESTPSTMATPDDKFRSFSKTKIVEDMEKGKVGAQLAFRNVQTGLILCCYADAEDFSGGKAYVSKDRVNYFYIDKKGNKVKE